MTASGGGHATYAGTQFEAGVAAWLATHLLADIAPRALGLDVDVLLTSLFLETAAAVDDILVETSQGGFCFINVKTRVENSSQSSSPLASVIDQFVRQILQSERGTRNRRWERPLDARRDRLVLVVDAQKSRKFADLAQGLLTHVRETSQLAGEGDERTAAQTKLLESLEKLVTAAWIRHTGDAPSRPQLLALLRLVRVLSLDLAGPDADVAQQLLGSSVVQGNRAAADAWRELNALCAAYAERRSGGTRETLVERLRALRIPLQASPDFRRDIERLGAVTGDTLEALERFAHLELPEAGRHVVIERPSTTALASHAASKSFLLIGEPGAGKSGALHAAALRLQKAGHPVVVLAVERHRVSTLSELSRDLQLEHPLKEVLARWSGARPGVLFIDALDASRGGPSDAVFRQLLQQVLQLPGWHVVASIRRFDLKFGVAYRDLFSGPAVDASFEDQDFARVRHLLVRKLSEEELEQVWHHSSQMRSTYDLAAVELRELLRSPFNLFLLSGVLRSGGLLPGGVATQVQLLNAFWERRVEERADLALAREQVLVAAVREMVATRSLSASLARLGSGTTEPLAALQSAEVLVQAKGRAVAFSHHMLFDFAAAKLLLEGGHVDFGMRVTSSDDMALLLAPAASMAFQMLWEEHPAHAAFWRTTIALAVNEGVGAFFRMLPARVIASLLRAPEEAAGLLAALRDGSDAEQSGARFLVRHCFGAVLTGGVVPEEQEVSAANSPWPALASDFAQADPDAGTWPWKAVVAQWTERSKYVSSAHEGHINSLARYVLGQSLKVGDAGAVIAGIRGVAGTVHSAVDQSEAALLALLDPERVERLGHKELFWLAQEVPHLAGPCPALVDKLYRAAFCMPLPSSKEATPLNDSRILALVSNKRQDVEGIRRQLSEHFGKYLLAQPLPATETLVAVIDYFVRHEHSGATGEANPITIGPTTAEYVPDGSGAWWDSSPDELHPSTAVGLLDAFASVLPAAVGASARMEEVLARLATGVGWACTWTALLRAAVESPEALAGAVVPLLTHPEVIGSLDGRHAAGEALRACHPHLSDEQRMRVERAVLQVGGEGRRVLLGCLPADALRTEEAIAARRALELEGPLPQNRPLITRNFRWIPRDETEEATRLGVDLSSRAQVALLAAVRTVEQAEIVNAADSVVRAGLATHWEEVVALHRALLEHLEVGESLQRHAWDVLAERLAKAADASDEPEHLVAFPEILPMVFDVLDRAPWPGRDSDPETEASFEKTPSWGSAPRVRATAALMAWTRAARKLVPGARDRISMLAQDGSPAVRHQVLARVNALAPVAPDLMWEVCEQAFDQERNSGVMAFFFSALRFQLAERTNWLSGRLLELEERLEKGELANQDYATALVELVLRLALEHDEPLAHARVQQWGRAPLTFQVQVAEALPLLRSALTQGGIDAPLPRDERVRRDAVAFYADVVRAAEARFSDSAPAATSSEPERSVAEAALRILDSAMMQVYFASGAREQGGAEDTASAKGRKRFLTELATVLETLGRVAYPSITHRFLETLEYFIPTDPRRVFQLLVHGLTHGGREGGYAGESMGAELFVRIVRRYLADHRDVLADDPDCRRGLVLALDEFVQVGWPEARRLVYELPELLR